MNSFIQLKSGTSIAKQPVRAKDFSAFCISTNYITIFERENEDLNWRNNDILLKKIETLNTKSFNDTYNPDVIYITERDAEEFCNWFKNARLPKLAELLEIGSSIDTSIARSASYELFKEESNFTLGFGIILPLPSEVENLNKIRNKQSTYEEVALGTIAPITLDGPMASFRIVIDK